MSRAMVRDIIRGTIGNNREGDEIPSGESFDRLGRVVESVLGYDQGNEGGVSLEGKEFKG
eukprot:750779-Hanusia_phi.AAC.1